MLDKFNSDNINSSTTNKDQPQTKTDNFNHPQTTYSGNINNSNVFANQQNNTTIKFSQTKVDTEILYYYYPDYFTNEKIVQAYCALRNQKPHRCFPLIFYMANLINNYIFRKKSSSLNNKFEKAFIEKFERTILDTIQVTPDQAQFFQMADSYNCRNGLYHIQVNPNIQQVNYKQDFYFLRNGLLSDHLTSLPLILYVLSMCNNEKMINDKINVAQRRTLLSSSNIILGIEPEDLPLNAFFTKENLVRNYYFSPESESNRLLQPDILSAAFLTYADAFSANHNNLDDRYIINAANALFFNNSIFLTEMVQEWNSFLSDALMSAGTLASGSNHNLLPTEFAMIVISTPLYATSRVEDKIVLYSSYSQRLSLLIDKFIAGINPQHLSLMMNDIQPNFNVTHESLINLKAQIDQQIAHLRDNAIVQDDFSLQFRYNPTHYTAQELDRSLFPMLNLLFYVEVPPLRRLVISTAATEMEDYRQNLCNPLMFHEDTLPTLLGSVRNHTTYTNISRMFIAYTTSSYKLERFRSQLYMTLVAAYGAKDKNSRKM